MVMGTAPCNLHSMVNEIKYDDFLNDQDAMNGFDHQSPNGSSGLSPNGTVTRFSSSTSHDRDASEDSEIFSDIVLSYINRMLNEDDIDEKLDMFQGHPALEATEKPFYEVLGEKYPNGSSISSGVVTESAFEFPSPQDYSVSVGYSSQSSFSSTNSIHNVLEGFEEPSLSIIGAGNLLASVSLPEWQYMRGVEEARKFLPSEDKLVINLEAIDFSLPRETKEDKGLSEVKAEKEVSEYSVLGSRGRKNRHIDDLGLEEGRSNKQSAVDYTEETLRSEMFDLVLLNHDCKSCAPPPVVMQNESSRTQKNSQSKGSGGGKGRGRKTQSKSEEVHLRTLLIHCAQAVATDDRRSVNELLKQIRQHASPFGNGTQRLALCFANGLEARLASTGSETYRSLMAKRATATDLLKAYQLYMAVCPFKRVSHFFAGQMILNTTEKASAVHILDFGIYFGFQWPSFFERLANRTGGPPKLRITGIATPQPGFRPSERIDETGRRLAEYARCFNIPFEYHAIATQWETIRIEDLKIDEGEVLVVNCLFYLKHLADETMEVDCPRNKVLRMIRELNPAIFIHGIVNGSYSAPFFVTRFRQALFHFSALSDMLETTTAREDQRRLLIEQNIFAREALNVIACEGSDRVERPETYKQWQARNLRAGFVQLPLDRDIMKKVKDKVKACYHKDFVINEDSRWLLQGWRGRIIFALSAWKPDNV